ncbi:MAG: hypothetical protein HY820_08575 [Acidobacteria bacterium]|nr:hypothetical protein [Acidobacteriota bacterium]
MPLFVLSLLIAFATVAAAEPPTAEISNDKVRVKVYLPDAKNGFYQGTRFDWSGVIYSLEANGHSYYGPWFTKRDKSIRDFVYEGNDIIAGPCSSTSGPADEFRPVGYDAAKPGGTFLKIGVGALRKPDDARYDAYRVYEIANPGKWDISRRPDSIEFTQKLTEGGYGYVYRKTLRLVKGKSEMVMVHSIRNTGKLAIETTTYNHNFLVIDGKGPQAGTTVSMPFAVRSARPPNAQLAEVSGSRLVYKKTLKDRETVSCPLEGFGPSASDHEFRIESPALKAGMSIRGDRPLQSINLWSIKSNVSVEPFVTVSVAPGKTFTWSSTYGYYTLP